MVHMKTRRFISAFFGAAILTLTGLASYAPAQGDFPAGSGARVTMRVGRGALLISATGGDGTLTFQGQSYRFKIGGMGLGLIGFTTVDAEGEVLNLSRIEDFAGAYVQGGADYAAGSGEGVLWLKNTKGVIMKLKSKTKGLSLAIGGEGLVVQMMK